MSKHSGIVHLTFVLCLLAIFTSPRGARADGTLPDYQLPLSPGARWSGAPVANASLLAAALVVEPREPQAVLRARQKLAQRILAAGAGLALSAVVTPIYVMPHREPCYGSARAKGRVPLTGAAVVGTLGLAMTVGGATWLGLERRGHGSYAARRERLIDVAIGALAFALGQTLQGSLFWLDQICHT